ncbi:MAG TPA: hypothetical protein VFZ25_04280, partial [Chloroflexota bacterium]|nr:hypothetical protein [Chloroflexota bacterium]
APEATASEARGAGLETVDRLLDALAADGLVGLGQDKLALFAAAGELVRARKLRRLGNRVLALQRAAESARGAELDPASFARLLSDLQLTRQVTGAHLEGRISLDAALAEDLLGKTWREADLEAVSGLELLELAAERTDDGEFVVETGYLIDLPTGAFYAEKLIQPRRFASRPRTRQRCRILVDDGRVYPDVPPRRLRLSRFRRAPLLPDDVARLLAHATEEIATLRAALVERLSAPLAPREIPVLFRPAALLSQDDGFGALDRAENFLALDLPPAWLKDLPSLLEPGVAYALFGLLRLADDGPRLRGRAIVGELSGNQGPIYPDG